ncbi:MAG: hypothetical protein ACNA8W_14015, partial [Bradymonadaceae bacterium]
ARQSSILGALKWDIGFLLLLIVLVLGYAFLQKPRFQPAVSEAVSGSPPPYRTEGDILLLLPDTPAAEAATMEELDCSYGWFNSLWQQYGSFATALNRDLSPQILAGRSVVIVPRRVVETMPAAGITALSNFARTGGQVVVELPVAGWEPLTQVSTAGKLRMAQRITAVEGLGVHGPMREHLGDTPLGGPLLPTARLDQRPAGPVIFEVEEQPGLLVQPLGKGRVFTILFDFGCSVTALHQGRPTREMKFGLPEGPALIPASDRVAHERLVTSHVPYADLLKRALFDRFSESRPLPRLWPYPGKHAGAFIMTHPTPDQPRAAMGYADWARKQDGITTLFFASDRLSTTEAALAAQTRSETGFLWVRGLEREPNAEAIGVGALRPFVRELTLNQQILQLQARLPPGQQVRLGHVEGTLFDRDWASTFKKLAAGNLRVDSSFGPSESAHFGYLFGTGMPFYPIDDRGLPLPILEQPFVLHSGSLTPARLKRMLVNSEAHFHQAITVSLASDAMATDPSVGILLGYRDAFLMARAHRHWATTLGDFIDFLSARRQSVLTSQWSTSKRRLTISVNVLGARLPTYEDGAVAGIAFPTRFEGEEILKVVVDGKDIAMRTLGTSGPGLERILEVPPGRHTISVYYARATETDEDEADDD